MAQLRFYWDTYVEYISSKYTSIFVNTPLTVELITLLHKPKFSLLLCKISEIQIYIL